MKLPLKWLLVVQTMHIVHYEYHLVKISYTIHSKSELGMHSLIQFTSHEIRAVLILELVECDVNRTVLAEMIDKIG